jgi:hypothetical protein
MYSLLIFVYIKHFRLEVIELCATAEYISWIGDLKLTPVQSIGNVLNKWLK